MWKYEMTLTNINYSSYAYGIHNYCNMVADICNNMFDEIDHCIERQNIISELTSNDYLINQYGFDVKMRCVDDNTIAIEFINLKFETIAVCYLTDDNQ